jgi:hypothetical protein
MRHFNVNGLRERGGADALFDALFIVLLALVSALLLHPFQNTPFVDDWVYAWPVENLLKTQQLRILEYSGAINLPQVLWGAIFTLPSGFSFTALRISTFVLSLVSLSGLYLLLRQLELPRRAALFPVAVLAAYPIFFILSFTFMTDVPFIACFIAASLALVVGLRQQSTAWLAIAATFIAASIGMRFVGLASAAAFGMVLLFHTGTWGRRCLWLALIPPAFFVFLLLWQHYYVVRPADITWVDTSPAARLRGLPYVVPLLPSMTVVAVGFLSGAVGMGLLPLAVSMLDRKTILRAALVLAILGPLAGLGLFLSLQAKMPFFLPFVFGSTWTLDELGESMSLVPGYTNPFNAPQWVYLSLGALGWSSTSVLLASLMRRPSTIDWFFIWTIVFAILMAAGLWLFYDRYALPVIVPLLVLVAAGKKQPRVTLAIPILALFAALSIIQTRDHLAYNAALFSALQQLRDFGALDSEINGGYVINGWNQYAHPENAPKDEAGAAQIPRLNANNKLRYEISNSLSPNAKLLASVPFHRWIWRSGQLYILDFGTNLNGAGRK